MLYLILSIFCSFMLTMVMRLSKEKVSGTFGMMSVNYLICFLLAACFSGAGELFSGLPGMKITFGLGAVNGIFYVLSLFMMQYNLGRNGVVLPSLFSQTGTLVIPLFLAIVFFRERPNLLQGIGAALAVFSVIMLNYGKEEGMKKSAIALSASFFLDGMASSGSKIYGEIGQNALPEHFLFYTFLIGFLFCIVLVFIRKEHIGMSEILFGVLLGLPNFFASRLFLKALEDISAVIAYPMKGICTVLLVTMAGLLFFREKLRKNQWAAIITVFAAIILLNLNS